MDNGHSAFSEVLREAIGVLAARFVVSSGLVHTAHPSLREATDEMVHVVLALRPQTGRHVHGA